MQELSLQQMKMVSGGVDIPSVTIDGGSTGAKFGSAATSVSVGSYSSPSIAGGAGGAVVKKVVEIVATAVVTKVVDSVADAINKATQPDPNQAAKDAAAKAEADRAAAAQAAADAAEAARNAASDRQAAKNRANSSK
jgi:hypothetical protein